MATQLAEMPVGLGGGEVAEQVEAQTPQERDFEAEARQQGWTPQEDFKGDPSRWIDAETFVKRADEVMPLLKKQNQAYKRDNEDLKRRIRKLERSEQAAYENARADLERQREDAVAAGDTTTFREVQKRVDKLDAEVRSELSTQAGAPSKEDVEDAYDAFRDKYAWYDKGALGSASEVEADARIYADRLADRYSRQGLQDQMTPAAFFDKIGEEVREKFPALGLKVPRPKPASDVAGVTPNRAPRGARTGANLPPEARRQAVRFYNMGHIKAKDEAEAIEKYAKDFDWS